jgi:hypothetical protein
VQDADVDTFTHLIVSLSPAAQVAVFVKSVYVPAAAPAATVITNDVFAWFTL